MIKNKYGSKLKKDFKQEAPWLFDGPPTIIINRDNPPILVYQMGKVGSTSVSFTLKQLGLPNPIYHVHQLTYEGINRTIEKTKQRLKKNRKSPHLDDRNKMYTDLYLKYIIRHLKNNRNLRKRIEKNLEKIPWKILTLVRDPVMREVSNFFSGFHRHPELMDNKGQLLKEKSLRFLEESFAGKFNNPKNWVLTWFDEEFKKVFGLDVYQFPFSPKKGYSIINSENMRILIIKLERLNQCFGPAIFEFLGKKEVKLIDRNVAKKRFYYSTYKYVLDHISLDHDLCQKIYSSKYARHFYTPEEIGGFVARWSDNPNHKHND
jgi:hypothetical protein